MKNMQGLFSRLKDDLESKAGASEIEKALEDMTFKINQTANEQTRLQRLGRALGNDHNSSTPMKRLQIELEQVRIKEWLECLMPANAHAGGNNICKMRHAREKTSVRLRPSRLSYRVPRHNPSAAPVLLALSPTQGPCGCPSLYGLERPKPTHWFEVPVVQPATGGLQPAADAQRTRRVVYGGR